MEVELEHGGDEGGDRGSESSSSSSKRSFGASSDATVSSTPSKLQALRFAEDLSLPSVQVVVMSANMGCSHCRQRVANVVSKMNAGLLDYMVDFGKKEVTVRGKVVHTKKKKKRHMRALLGAAGAGWDDARSAASLPGGHARTLSWFWGCYSS
uniref:HMA domain-containing protein n=2 Tax=Zea mays TaxID=4577 RepID=A0A804QTR4_MAIZE